MNLFDWLPAEGTHLVFVLFLSFLVGLEREERKAADDRFAFGGVRTFPLIGLIGYSVALLSRGELLPQTIGFAVVAGFLLLSYWHKISSAGYPGVTSEMSGLATYLVGALVYREQYWIALAITVASVLLLELKTRLEDLARRIEAEDILTFTKFLLLSAVILPVLPNIAYTVFQINPYKTWLVVVAVSGVSYGSYVLQRLLKEQGGVILTAMLGGAYSSTVTTVALARRAKAEGQAHLFAGSILMASGVMYLRLAVLLGLFNRELMVRLAPSFVVLSLLAVGAGWFWSQRRDQGVPGEARTAEPRNPLEISAALAFALLFVAMLVATHLASVYLGDRGVYTLAAVMGVTDVDPFIMGITQSAPAFMALPVAGNAILIAAASNNLVKGLYAYWMSAPACGRQSLAMLSALAVLGLAPLLW